MGLAAATIGAGVLGAGATALASSNASKAAQKAGQLQYDAAQQATAEQKRQFDYIQQQNEPFRQIGLSSAQALAAGMGLSPASMTGSAASTAPTTLTAYPMTGSKTPGGTVIDLAPQADGSYAMPSTTTLPAATASTSSDGKDWLAYLQQNPDALANFQQLQASGRTDALATDPVAFAKYHWAADGSRRDVPNLATTPTAPADPNAPKPGYADPTAPNGYTMGPRPDPGAKPMTYTAPALDTSLGAYQQSPGYNFQVSEANKALDNLSSSMGGVLSGARIKAAEQRANDLALQDYGQWRDYTTNQYNNDRNFGYTQAQNDLSQWNTDRNVSNGLYQDDRSNANQRYDTRNSTLMSLAGFGTGANASNASAAQSFATNAGNNLMTGAQAQGGAAINSANAWTSGVNNLITTGAYLGGRYMTSNPFSAGAATATPSYGSTLGSVNYGGALNNFSFGG